MLGAKRHWFRPIGDGLGRAAQRVGLAPDHVTWAALVVACGGAVLVGFGWFIVGALVVSFGALLDMVDGSLARLSGRVSLAGGYLDSLFDRVVDFAVLFAVMVHYDDTRTWIAGTVALFGAITTSFAKARVFQDLHPDASVWGRDLFERAERYLLLMPAILAQGILDATGTDLPILFWALVGLAVAVNATVVQRMVVAMRVMREAERRA